MPLEKHCQVVVVFFILEVVKKTVAGVNRIYKADILMMSKDSSPNRKEHKMM